MFETRLRSARARLPDRSVHPTPALPIRVDRRVPHARSVSGDGSRRADRPPVVQSRHLARRAVAGPGRLVSRPDRRPRVDGRRRDDLTGQPARRGRPVRDRARVGRPAPQPGARGPFSRGSREQRAQPLVLLTGADRAGAVASGCVSPRRRMAPGFTEPCLRRRAKSITARSGERRTAGFSRSTPSARAPRSRISSIEADGGSVRRSAPPKAGSRRNVQALRTGGGVLAGAEIRRAARKTSTRRPGPTARSGHDRA